jgi:hypothetical protein
MRENVPMCKGGKPGARLVPTGLAALAAGVTAATIRKWASRGKIRRFGTPRKALYDLDELMLLVDGRDKESSS